MPVVLQSPSPEAAQLALTGLNHASALLRDLLKRNPDYLTDTIETGAFASWLYEDNPTFESTLNLSGSQQHFERRLGRYLSLANDSRKILRAMEELAQREQSDSAVNESDSRHLQEVLKKRFSRWNDAVLHDTLVDAGLLIRTIRDFTSAWASGGKLLATPKRHRVADRSPALVLAHEYAKSQTDTCYLVRSSELPDTMRELVAERYCVVVPLAAQFDESWIFHSSATNFRFEPLVFTDAPSFNEIRMMLAVQDGVMFDYEAMTGSVFRKFRAELPVVYVTRSSSLLVSYPFQPFFVDSRCHGAHTELDIEWDLASTESFEALIRDRHLDNLPRHKYAFRSALDLTGECMNAVAWPILPHWTREDV
jgi:hypothetical protein